MSNPSRCRFFAKNSEMEISRWALDMLSAVAKRRAVFFLGDDEAGPRFPAEGVSWVVDRVRRGLGALRCFDPGGAVRCLISRPDVGCVVAARGILCVAVPPPGENANTICSVWSGLPRGGCAVLLAILATCLPAARIRSAGPSYSHLKTKQGDGQRNVEVVD